MELTKENMYTAQQFAMSEPLSETQGLDNKSSKKPNKQGKSKKDKDKYTLRACSIQKRIDVETKVGPRHLKKIFPLQSIWCKTE